MRIFNSEFEMQEKLNRRSRTVISLSLSQAHTHTRTPTHTHTRTHASTHTHSHTHTRARISASLPIRTLHLSDDIIFKATHVPPYPFRRNSKYPVS